MRLNRECVYDWRLPQVQVQFALIVIFGMMHFSFIFVKVKPIKTDEDYSELLRKELEQIGKRVKVEQTKYVWSREKEITLINPYKI